MYYNMQRVDDEGVLTLVQSIRYNPGDMSFSVRFFDGCKAWFDSMIVPSVGLMQRGVSNMQMYEAEQWLIKNREKYWEDIHK